MGPCLFAKVIVKSIFTKLLTLPNCALFVILIHFLDSVMVGMWSTLASMDFVLHGAYTFKTLSIRSKTKNQGAATSCQLANALVFVSPGNQVGVGSPEEDLNQHPSDSLSCMSEEHGECGLVDALAVAISHVKMLEPKRSRLWGPTGP
ncbi:hypothetical protein Peur_013606 [Populus x canadensis]